MKLKADLHFHSSEDPVDVIGHSLFEGIDKAAELGFDVLASTCHTKNVCTPEHVAYAEKRGVLLIPGIEANIYEENSDRQNHVVILNCDSSANRIRTFADLRQYREDHPEIFVLAAHPYFYGTFSLGKRLLKYIDLFDAVEHSWFYTKWFNRNIKAALVATLHKKPMLATSDTHFFDFVGESYTTVEVQEKTIQSFFEAIRNFKYENTSKPRTLFEIFFVFGAHEILQRGQRILRTLKNKKEEELPFLHEP